jgi:hypothetical protein
LAVGYADAACPKIIQTDTELEFYQSRASLIATDTLGNALAMPDNIRLFLFSNLQHFAVANAASQDTRVCAFPTNPLNGGPPLRALLVALDAWIANGILPPPSRYPSRADGTLVPPTAEAVGFPQIPGIKYTGLTTKPTAINFDLMPPIKGRAYPEFVPKTDADGRDLSGVRLPTLEAPIATHTGWNIRKPGFAEGELCGFFGTMLPFAATREERLKNNDPRLSVAERYPQPRGPCGGSREGCKTTCSGSPAPGGGCEAVYCRHQLAIASSGMSIPRRHFLQLASGAAALSARIAWAQAYPSRPITLVVPFAAGGALDVIARILTPKMRAPLGQTIIIENVAGASGSLGVGRVARGAAILDSREKLSYSHPCIQASEQPGIWKRFQMPAKNVCEGCRHRPSSATRPRMGCNLRLWRQSRPVLRRLFYCPPQLRRARRSQATSASPLGHIHSDVEIEAAIVDLGREPGGGLVGTGDSFTLAHRAPIILAAARNNVPAVYAYSDFARDGGLLSYGVDQADNWRRAASYVDRILRGAKPGDLPVQFPAKYEMAVNLKTAKALGLTVPQSILLRADEVIE